jgi:hypothetical protein
MAKWIAAVFLVLVSGFGSLAKAGTEPGGLPYEHIADYTSNPGESEHAFLIRMVPVFRAWANKTAMEACAEIGSDGAGRYGLVVGTSRSHLGCVIDDARVLPGMAGTGETIHTHGRCAPFAANRADMVLMDPATASAVDAVRAMRRPLLNGQTLDQFSAADYNSGPGYLATPTGLIYQHGDGTAAAVN